MNFFFTCIYIFMKKLLSSKSYIISMLTVPFVILILCLFIPDSYHSNINIGIMYDCSSNTSNEIVNILSDSENYKYKYFNFNEEKEMIRQIASNELHVGYIITKDIDYQIENRNYKNIITKISSQSSYLSPIIDETVCSSAIQVLTPYIADNYILKSKIVAYDDSLINYLKNSTSNYLINGDIMSFELFINSENSNMDTDNSYKLTIFSFVCLALSICLFTINILVSIFNIESNKKLFLYYKSSCGKYFYIKLYSMISLSVVSLIFVFISLLILSIFIDIETVSIYSVLIMFFSFTVFTGGLCSLIENHSKFGKILILLMPAVIFGNLIFSGILIDPNILGNIFGKISYIFPAKYFLTGLLDLNHNLLSVKNYINPLLLLTTGIFFFFISLRH